ncbi:enterotoxin A family protein [bacterium]|nr:enterotoxin A family protein [bacterium]
MGEPGPVKGVLGKIIPNPEKARAAYPAGIPDVSTGLAPGGMEGGLNYRRSGT